MLLLAQLYNFDKMFAYRIAVVIKHHRWFVICIRPFSNTLSDLGKYITYVLHDFLSFFNKGLVPQRVSKMPQ